MSKRDLKIFLEDILDSIKRIEEYTKDKTEKEFLDDYEKQDAIIRRLEIIGEAVKNLPLEFKKKHQEVEWREIAGLRDKLIHEYFGILMERVWDTAKNDIPRLKKQILGLLEKF